MNRPYTPANNQPATPQQPVDYSNYGYGGNHAQQQQQQHLTPEQQQAQWHQQWQQYYAQQAAVAAAGGAAAATPAAQTPTPQHQQAPYGQYPSSQQQQQYGQQPPYPRPPQHHQQQIHYNPAYPAQQQSPRPPPGGQQQYPPAPPAAKRPRYNGPQDAMPPAQQPPPAQWPQQVPPGPQVPYAWPSPVQPQQQSPHYAAPNPLPPGPARGGPPMRGGPPHLNTAVNYAPPPHAAQNGRGGSRGGAMAGRTSSRGGGHMANNQGRGPTNAPRPMAPPHKNFPNNASPAGPSRSAAGGRNTNNNRNQQNSSSRAGLSSQNALPIGNGKNRFENAAARNANTPRTSLPTAPSSLPAKVTAARNNPASSSSVSSLPSSPQGMSSKTANAMLMNAPAMNRNAATLADQPMPASARKTFTDFKITAIHIPAIDWTWDLDIEKRLVQEAEHIEDDADNHGEQSIVQHDPHDQDGDGDSQADHDHDNDNGNDGTSDADVAPEDEQDTVQADQAAAAGAHGDNDEEEEESDELEDDDVPAEGDAPGQPADDQEMKADPDADPDSVPDESEEQKKGDVDATEEYHGDNVDVEGGQPDGIAVASSEPAQSEVAEASTQPSEQVKADPAQNPESDATAVDGSSVSAPAIIPKGPAAERRSNKQRRGGGGNAGQDQCRLKICFAVAANNPPAGAPTGPSADRTKNKHGAKGGAQKRQQQSSLSTSDDNVPVDQPGASSEQSKGEDGTGTASDPTASEAPDAPSNGPSDQQVEDSAADEQAASQSEPASESPNASAQAENIQQNESSQSASSSGSSWVPFAKHAPSADANRIVILYAAGRRRLSLDADVVKSVRVHRQERRIELVVRVVRPSVEAYRKATQSPKFAEQKEWSTAKGILLESRRSHVGQFSAVPRNELEFAWEHRTDVHAAEERGNGDNAKAEAGDGGEADDSATHSQGDSNEQPIADGSYVSLPPLFRLSDLRAGPAVDGAGDADASVKVEEDPETGASGSTEDRRESVAATQEEIVVTVAMDRVGSFPEAKWLKTGDVEDWLSTLPGFAQRPQDQAWRGKIHVVDPDPPPTIQDVFSDWSVKSFMGAAKDRRRFIRDYLQTAQGQMEIFCRLVRGERASSSAVQRDWGKNPLAEAARKTAFASHQTHLSLAVMAIFDLAQEYATVAGATSRGTVGKEEEEVDEDDVHMGADADEEEDEDVKSSSKADGKGATQRTQSIGNSSNVVVPSPFELRVSEILMSMPQNLLFKALDGLWKEVMEKNMRNAGSSRAGGAGGGGNKRKAQGGPPFHLHKTSSSSSSGGGGSGGSNKRAKREQNRSRSQSIARSAQGGG